MQKCCDYLKNGKKRYRPFINGYLHRHQAKEIVYRKKKQSQNYFRLPSSYSRKWTGTSLKTRLRHENEGECHRKCFFWTYEKVLPYLSFCYLHSLRNLNTNARAGGAYLNLFSFHHLCIWFRSVVVITSLAETIFLSFNFSFSSLESKNYVRKTDMCFVFWGKDPTGKKFVISFVN